LFSKEEMKENSFKNSDDHFSVDSDKGSVQKAGNKPVEAKASKSKISNFWKRVDMRQKKVIRGLSGLTKDYFKDLVDTRGSEDLMFKAWDDKLKSLFPQLYQESRFRLLGDISVVCLSWKFIEKIRCCNFFTDEEKATIIKYGEGFKTQRARCSNSSVRKQMLNSPLVQIGKLLYYTSQAWEESFWNQILERKKSDIVEFQVFKEAHLKDFQKIDEIAHSGPI